MVTGALEVGTFVTGTLEVGTFVTGALDVGAFEKGEILGFWEGKMLGDAEGATTGAALGTATGARENGDSDPGMVGNGGVKGAFDVTGALVGKESGGRTGDFVGCRVVGGMGAIGAVVFIL